MSDAIKVYSYEYSDGSGTGWGVSAPPIPSFRKAEAEYIIPLADLEQYKVQPKKNGGHDSNGWWSLYEEDVEVAHLDPIGSTPYGRVLLGDWPVVYARDVEVLKFILERLLEKQKALQ